MVINIKESVELLAYRTGGSGKPYGQINNTPHMHVYTGEIYSITSESVNAYPCPF
jgi:hypothetical protein